MVLFRFEITSAKHATEATWNRGVNYKRSKTLLDNKPANKEHEKDYFELIIIQILKNTTAT